MNPFSLEDFCILIFFVWTERGSSVFGKFRLTKVKIDRLAGGSSYVIVYQLGISTQARRSCHWSWSKLALCDKGDTIYGWKLSETGENPEWLYTVKSGFRMRVLLSVLYRKFGRDKVVKVLELSVCWWRDGVNARKTEYEEGYQSPWVTCWT